MRSIAINGRKPHLFRDKSGNAPIVIALPNEYAGDVFARLKESTSDGGVNVIIAFAKRYDVIAFDSSAKAEADMEVGGDLSMGMLALKMSSNPGKAIRVNVRNQTVDVPASASFEYA